MFWWFNHNHSSQRLHKDFQVRVLNSSLCTTKTISFHTFTVVFSNWYNQIVKANIISSIPLICNPHAFYWQRINMCVALLMLSWRIPWCCLAFYLNRMGRQYVLVPAEMIDMENHKTFRKKVCNYCFASINARHTCTM